MSRRTNPQSKFGIVFNPVEVPSTLKHKVSATSYTNSLDHFDEFQADIMNDSATQIMNKLTARANKGCQVENMGQIVAGDLFVKSAHTHVATPTLSGSAFAITFPSLAEVGGINAQLNAKLSSLFNRPMEMHGMRPEAYTEVCGYNTGERSARAFLPEDKVPIMASKVGSAVQASRRLKARAQLRGDPHHDISACLDAMWGINTDGSDLAEPLELAGSAHTRMAVLDDKSYHALMIHTSKSGSAKVAQAPMTQNSIAPGVPIPWSRMRQTLSAIATVNLACDRNLHKYLQAQSVSIFYDIVEDSLPSYAHTRSLHSVLEKTSVPQFLGSKSVQGAKLIMAQRYAQVSEMRNVQLLKIEERLTDMLAANKLNANILDDDSTAVNTFSSDIDSGFSVNLAVTVPRVAIKVESLPAAKALHRSKTNALGDLVAPVSGYGMSVAEAVTRSATAAATTIQADIGSIFRYTIMALVLDKRSYPAQSRLLGLVPNPGSKMALKAERLYTSEKVRQACCDLLTESFVAAFFILSSLSGNTHTAASMYSAVNRWAISKGYTAETAAGDIYTLWFQIVMCQTMTKVRYWMRVACGRATYACQGTIYADLFMGETVSMATLVEKHIKNKMAKWAAYYDAKAKNLQETITACSKLWLTPVARARKTDTYRELVIAQGSYRAYSSTQVRIEGSRILAFLPINTVIAMFKETAKARKDKLERKAKLRQEKYQRLNKQGKDVTQTYASIYDVNPLHTLEVSEYDDLSTLLDYLGHFPKHSWTIEPRVLWDKIKRNVEVTLGEVPGEIHELVVTVAKSTDIPWESGVLAQDLEDRYGAPLHYRLNLPVSLGAPVQMLELAEDDEPSFLPDASMMAMFMSVHVKSEIAAPVERAYMTVREVLIALEVPESEWVWKKMKFSSDISVELDDSTVNSPAPYCVPLDHPEECLGRIAAKWNRPPKPSEDNNFEIDDLWDTYGFSDGYSGQARPSRASSSKKPE